LRNFRMLPLKTSSFMLVSFRPLYLTRPATELQ
jgi:hypothetical protein